MEYTHQPTEVGEVYELLRTHGPATAYAYMEHARAQCSFPPSLVTAIRVQIQMQLLHQHEARKVVLWTQVPDTKGAFP